MDLVSVGPCSSAAPDNSAIPINIIRDAGETTIGISLMMSVVNYIISFYYCWNSNEKVLS